MRCDDLRGLLNLHLDEELDEAMTARIERHLLRCPACAFEARALDQTRARLREAVPQEEAAPAFRERTSARLHTVFAAHLRETPAETGGRQWTLPFAASDRLDSVAASDRSEMREA